MDAASHGAGAAAKSAGIGPVAGRVSYNFGKLWPAVSCQRPGGPWQPLIFAKLVKKNLIVFVFVVFCPSASLVALYFIPRHPALPAFGHPLCLVPRPVQAALPGHYANVIARANSWAFSLRSGSAVWQSDVSAITKNLYTRLYIYAKRAALLYKYTAIVTVLRDANSGKTQRTRTVFRVVGAISGHREDCESNNILQNKGI